MSYKALYRKYRPKTFDEILGQDQIVLTLKNIISQNKVSHAYLFAGPRGTGKTSVAHVFAREVNKTSAGTIVENNIDVIEIDAASNNGVAEVRNIIDNSKYAPSNSKYKIYIVDEVHMLTKGAFNALLKTLEEPPEKVIFILATTEPHKIPVTILSRTQRFNFKRINEQVIVSQLENILQKENIKYEDDAIKFIARLAQGGMRDALSIADQSASYSNGDIKFSDISQIFGIISLKHQINILNLAFNDEAKKLIKVLDEFINNGIDLERLTFSLIDILKEFIFYEKTNDYNLIHLLTSVDINEITFDATFAYKAADELVALSSAIKFSSIPKQLFELALLKITNPKSDNEIKEEKEVVVSKEKVNEIKEEIVEESEIVKPVMEKTPEAPVESDENVSQVFDTEEINISNNDIDKADDEAIFEQENITNNIALDEDILSTQDIPLNEMKEETTTDEIDLVSMFNSETSEEVVNPKTNDYSIDDIINLLLNAGNREQLKNVKTNLENVVSYIEEAPDPTYITLLENVKFISSGDNFLLVSSEDESTVKQLKDINENQIFINFIAKIFNRPLMVYPLTKEMFLKVKDKWQEYAATNSFPEKKPVKKIDKIITEEDKAKKLGEDIFGDLFK